MGKVAVHGRAGDRRDHHQPLHHLQERLAGVQVHQHGGAQVLHALWIGDRNLRADHQPAWTRFLDPHLLHRLRRQRQSAAQRAVPAAAADDGRPALATADVDVLEQAAAAPHAHPQVAVARADGAVLLTPAQVSGGARGRGVRPGEPHHAADRQRSTGAAYVQQRPARAPVRPARVHPHLRLLSVRVRARLRRRTGEADPRSRVPQRAARQRHGEGHRHPRGRAGPAARRASAVVAPAVDHLDRDRQVRRARFSYRSGRRQIDGCARDLATGLTGLDLDAVRLPGEHPAQRQRQERVAVVAGGRHRGAGPSQRGRRRGHRHRLGGGAVQLDRSVAAHPGAQTVQTGRERRCVGQLAKKQDLLQIAGAGALRTHRERHTAAQDLDWTVGDDQVPAVVPTRRPYRAHGLRAGQHRVAVVVPLRCIQQQPDVLAAAHLLPCRRLPEAVAQHRRCAGRGHRRRAVEPVTHPERHALLADVDLPAVDHLRFDGFQRHRVVAGGDAVDPVIAGHVDMADERFAHGGVVSWCVNAHSRAGT